MKLSTSLSANIRQLELIFPIGQSFDLITRNLYLGNTKAYWLGINGFCKNEILLKILSDLQNLQFTKDETIYNLKAYMSAKIGYIQAEQVTDSDVLIKNVLSGASVLLVDGFDTAVILDTRTYPARSIEEPDGERVTRGAKDGFVETLVFNTALIRRRIRNPKLTFEIHTIGTDSKTDVAIGYIGGHTDKDMLYKLQTYLDGIKVSSLTMGAKSLEELLIKKKWYQPLPQIRFTERPDVATSFLLEGYTCVLVDNSPTVMIFPCNIFQFTQNPDDYYQNPSVGSYFRFMRFACILISLFLMPLFLLFGLRPDLLPMEFKLITSGSPPPLALFIYVLAIELGLDLFKYSSALAPSGYSQSLGLIGGLLIGQIAVDLKWLNVEALFYGAATLLATVSITSKELSDALRLYRLFLVLLIGFGGILDFYGLLVFGALWGFGIGTLLILISAATTKTFGGKSYFWPLFPFHFHALCTLLFRFPTPKAQNWENKK